MGQAAGADRRYCNAPCGNCDGISHFDLRCPLTPIPKPGYDGMIRPVGWPFCHFYSVDASTTESALRFVLYQRLVCPDIWNTAHNLVGKGAVTESVMPIWAYVLTTTGRSPDERNALLSSMRNLFAALPMAKRRNQQLKTITATYSTGQRKIMNTNLDDIINSMTAGTYQRCTR